MGLAAHRACVVGVGGGYWGWRVGHEGKQGVVVGREGGRGEVWMVRGRGALCEADGREGWSVVLTCVLARAVEVQSMQRTAVSPSARKLVFWV